MEERGREGPLPPFPCDESLPIKYREREREKGGNKKEERGSEAPLSPLPSPLCISDQIERKREGVSRTQRGKGRSGWGIRGQTAVINYRQSK